MASFCFTTEGHQLVPKTISLYVSQNIMTQAAGGSVVVECENVGVGDLGGGGGDSHMERVGMLVVLLRGVNFGLWSHLGCSGQNSIICSHEGLL